MHPYDGICLGTTDSHISWMHLNMFCYGKDTRPSMLQNIWFCLQRNSEKVKYREGRDECQWLGVRECKDYKGTILRKLKVDGTVLYDNMIIDI